MTADITMFVNGDIETISIRNITRFRMFKTKRFGTILAFESDLETMHLREDYLVEWYVYSEEVDEFE